MGLIKHTQNVFSHGNFMISSGRSGGRTTGCITHSWRTTGRA